MTTRDRIQALLAIREAFTPWTGAFDEADLLGLLEAQLGSAEALDAWIPRGDTRCRAFPRSPLLHVVSGNTPHAAFQSVFRGLLVGARNRVKLPSAGLPEFEEWAATLPAPLARLLEVRHDLPDDWLQCAGAVVFGGEDTLVAFRAKLPRTVPLIEHGPKLSIAVVFEATAEAAALAATDILAFEQRGCLSVQAVYVDGDAGEARAFAALLANAMAASRHAETRAQLTLSESGAIANARELARFREANGDGVQLFESRGDTSWTVVFDSDPTLAPGPLNGFVTVHPLPPAASLQDQLGAETAWLSTVAIHPFDDANADRVEPLAAPRVCALGRSQLPPLFWNHDGRPPLADLVTWRDRA